jgi:hypothetical protein
LANAQPQPESKADLRAKAKPERQPDSKAGLPPQADAEPPTSAKQVPGGEAKQPPAHGAKADVEALLNTTLGDLLLAGVLKHPENAGHIIADAITEAEAAVGARVEAEPNDPAPPASAQKVPT